ncbi:MAG TPA: hypothetical protein VIH56_06750 [Candidatus Acidoferrales bacterium]
MTTLRTQKQIVHEIYNGQSPPLLSREGDVAAKKLGAGLTFEAATTLQYGGPDKNTDVDDLFPPTQGPTAPDDAFAVAVGKAPVASAAGIGTSPETVFTEATTNHGGSASAPKIPSPMSERGKKLASRTAPKSIF